jgi:stage V sporulation protein D (sporulation-specific penicillin-binding protein)
MSKINFKAQRRMIILLWLFFLGMFIVVLRMGYYQIIKGDEYKEKAAEQQTRDQSVAAKRGNIYDRNMKVIAQSATCENVMINPRQIQSSEAKQEKRKAAAALNGEAFDEEDVIEKIVSNLTELLDVDEDFLRKEIAGDYASRYVKKQVDQSVANQIRELELPGVFFEESTKRYYPYSNFASHVVGFVGSDGHGLTGIESTLDDTLSGTAGRIQVVQDVNNNDTPYEYENYIAPEDGQSVVLTIDEVLQHYTEKYLEEAYNLYNIQNGAAAIMMNPKTGEILAMAVKPDFDLNQPRYVSDEMKELILSESLLDSDGNEKSDSDKIQNYLNKLWRNKAVNDTYEPGSTFKSIVAASAVESGAVNPSTDTFFCSGVKVVAGNSIHCHKSAGHGSETFFKALENSCNPAFMEIGARLGKDRFREYLDAFGFRQSTNFLLPGESKGIFFSDSSFNDTELATSSFGQGFTVTPLQLITAFSAVVNGGNLMKPQLVKAYADTDGNITKTVESEVVRQVISESTSKIMRTALEGVVANGTGNGGYVAGYRIGGKTGTSEKTPRGQGKYVASFIGFAPADDPELVCLVLCDEPGGAIHSGGAIAAPTVGKILADSLKYLGYEPQYTSVNSEEVKIEVPTLTSMSVSEARKAAEAAGFTVSVKGTGTEVVNQLPKAGSSLKSGGIVILYTETDGEESKTTVPNFTGMRKSEAVAAASSAGLSISAVGGGASETVNDDMVAVKQSPVAGAEVSEGSSVTVNFAYDNND